LDSPSAARSARVKRSCTAPGPSWPST
jgi:hypothetical protein